MPGRRASGGCGSQRSRQLGDLKDRKQRWPHPAAVRVASVDQARVGEFGELHLAREAFCLRGAGEAASAHCADQAGILHAPAVEQLPKLGFPRGTAPELPALQRERLVLRPPLLAD